MDISSIFLQIFLIANVFAMGVLANIAVRHANAHFNPKKTETHKANPQNQAVHLPNDVKEKLLQSAQVRFQSVLNHSANDLEHNLGATAEQLGKKIDKLSNEIIDVEMKRYQETLEQLRKQTESSIAGAQTEIINHQNDLKTKLTDRQEQLEKEMVERVKAEEQLLIRSMETKLGDAVASFLSETLQHNVDLGAQSSYLIATLEEHKQELTKGISDET